MTVPHAAALEKAAQKTAEIWGISCYEPEFAYCRDHADSCPCRKSTAHIVTAYLSALRDAGFVVVSVVTVRAIADFPITDPATNMDAHSMRFLARAMVAASVAGGTEDRG